MTDRNEMNCDEFAEVAAELALGVLTGRDRARALAHMERCDACREDVRQLTMTGEELLGLLPAMEPTPGFETRVMERIGLAVPGTPESLSAIPSASASPSAAVPAPRPAGAWYAKRTRRMLAAAAAVVVIAGAALGGWGLRGASSPASAGPLSSAALVSVQHQTVGKIFLYDGSSRWIYMSVDLPAATGTVTCQLVDKNGHVTTIGSFWLAGGDGAWGSPEPMTHGQLSGARLVSGNGTVLATATFT